VLKVGIAGLVGLSLTVGTANLASAEKLDGRRIFVIDGDTVALPCKHPAPGCAERIRLTAIDAPETYHPSPHFSQGLRHLNSGTGEGHGAPIASMRARTIVPRVRVRSAWI